MEAGKKITEIASVLGYHTLLKMVCQSMGKYSKIASVGLIV